MQSYGMASPQQSLMQPAPQMKMRSLRKSSNIDSCKSNMSLKASSKQKKKSGGLFSMFGGFGGGSVTKESK
jgi:hypothetical protein